ncbi:hypothetical protein HDU76_012709 [Blyttiomyces sp. JEL0837]|nr:hypothetical protein HDU76_012709 [Blyttiomyces sp. JEL0837]
MIAITSLISLLSIVSLGVIATPVQNRAAATSYTACPNYKDIIDRPSVAGFKQESYQGEWYTLADTEPTEPSFCGCDKITWTLDAGDETFTDPLQAACFGYPFFLNQGGPTFRDPQYQGLRVEGSPDVPGATGAANGVLYVDENKGWQANKKIYRYQNAIVFSCGENYLGAPVFTSLQIFSRDPKTPRSEIDRLVAKAHELVLFNDSQLTYRQDASYNCVYPTTRLSCPPGCAPEKCIGGMYGVRGVPEPQCRA